MTATLTPTTEAATTARPTRRPVKRIVLHVFLCIVALSWLFPLGWAVLNSFRDYAYTAIHGYVSFGGFTLQNYVNA
jgi:multiple sugar transport system permease protein